MTDRTGNQTINNNVGIPLNDNTTCRGFRTNAYAIHMFFSIFRRTVMRLFFVVTTEMNKGSFDSHNEKQCVLRMYLRQPVSIITNRR